MKKVSKSLYIVVMAAFIFSVSSFGLFVFTDKANAAAWPVTGYKFNDLNQDGIWDKSNEPALNGWEICLTERDGKKCVITGDSDYAGDWDDGYYRFFIFSSRQVKIEETMQDGWIQSAPALGYYDQWMGQGLSNRNFGNYEPFCGDNKINQSFEECDGSAPDNYSCTNDCTLEYIPYCGDNEVNQSTEQCDGTDGITGNQTCSNECTIIEPEPEPVVVPIVLGEEAFPALSIDKSVVDVPFANPGDTIAYTIVVTNTGDAVAQNVTLIDTLPSGLHYVDTMAMDHSWDLGDILDGDSVTITYDVTVDNDTLSGSFINTATVWGTGISNQTDTAPLEVRVAAVLGVETLPVTGAGMLPLFLSAAAGLAAVGFNSRKRR